MPVSGDQKNYLTPEALHSGDFRILGRAISSVENGEAGASELLKNLPHKPIPVIGITGPPGAGKSTLVDGLTRLFTEAGKKIAILCVDPSSAFHTGALLGDRIRMNRWNNNPNVFIRSLSSRGMVGGLNPRIFQISDLVAHAGFDYVLIETVGVGQTEVDVASLANEVVLVLVPESGDDIQTMKSGILEIGNIFVVNKSDRPGADQFLASLKSSMHLQAANSSGERKFIQTTATEEKGLVELYQAIMENIAKDTPDRSQKLLNQKAWQLVSDYRMRGLNKTDLENALKKGMETPDFNLYRFAEQFAEK